MAKTVVIGYDGSADAKRAVEAAAELLGADAVVVAHGWQLPIAVPDGIGGFAVPTAPAVDQRDDYELQAHGLAREGADRARRAGVDVTVEVRQADGAHEIARALIEIAAARDAAAIVVGRRGMSRLESIVMGSVSEALVRDAQVPVLVVPLADDGA